MINKEQKKQNIFAQVWHKKWVRICSYFFACLLAIILVFNKPIANFLVRSYQPMINSEVIREGNQADSKNDYSSIKHLTLAQIAKARANANHIPIIGQITIPSVGINLPIAKGINNNNLALAAGTFRSNMKMGKGNYALAGHNMSNLGPKVLFSPLYYKAKPGQKIYVTDMKKVYVYQITSKKFVSKYRVDLIKNTHKKMITLITCDATGANRLCLRGKLIKSMDYRQAPLKIRQELNSKFNS